MARCELIETCIFFNDQMANMPATSAVYKKIYCEEDYAVCGRYLIFRAIGRAHPRYRTPGPAILLTGALGIGFVLLRTFEQLADLRADVALAGE